MSMYSDKKQSISASFNERPPQVLDELIKILSKHKTIPACMPQIKLNAAKWFVVHQEPADEYRDRPQKIEKDGEIKGWSAPYVDRLKVNLQIFLGLTEPEQYFVAEHVAEGVPWRGDNIKMYSMIIDEHRLMMEDKPKYIEQAARKMKAVLNAY